MTDHDDMLYLEHIDETAELIERTAAGRTRQEFEYDENLRDATIFRLQTMAESTQRLSDTLKRAHEEIPWERVAGFRNRVVHGYLDVNLDVVWGIVQHDMPSLARCVRSELAQRKGREGPGRDQEPDLGIGL